MGTQTNMTDEVKKAKLEAVVKLTDDPAIHLLCEIMLADIKKNAQPPAKEQECGFAPKKADIE